MARFYICILSILLTSIISCNQYINSRLGVKMYEFMNDKSKLQTLKASGTGGILVFETETEKAYVSLSNNSIDEVLHIYKPNGIATIFFEKDVFQLEVGEGNNKRTVKHYLKPNKDAPHLQLRLGITEHSSCGSWSSLPHDFENNPEPGFEEVFFYMINDSKQSEGKTIQ